MVKVGIVGSTGRVGSLLIDDLANDEQARVAAVHVFDKLKKQVPEDTIVTNDMRVLLDSSDVIIDFSAPSATEALLTEVIENGNGKPLVIATTGFNKHQQNLLFELLNIHIKYVKIKLVNILQKGNMKWRYTLLMKQKDA